MIIKSYEVSTQIQYKNQIISNMILLTYIIKIITIHPLESSYQLQFFLGKSFDYGQKFHTFLHLRVSWFLFNLIGTLSSSLAFLRIVLGLPGALLTCTIGHVFCSLEGRMRLLYVSRNV